MKQNNPSKNDTILLFDSSMNFQDVNKIIKEKKPRIITFDYESHIIFEEKNICHDISDIYISKNDLDIMQKKSYLFAYWFDESKISDLVQYDGINIGELFYFDFYHQLIPIFKNFFIIMKLFEANKNSSFITSTLLFDTVSCFTTSVIEIRSNEINSKICYDAIKIPFKIGNFSHSFTIPYNYLQNLTKIFEKLFKLLLLKHHKSKNGNTVLFIDFTTKKYNVLFNIIDKFLLNVVKFDRIVPAVWNFESYSIIKKSNCLIENYSTLIDKSLKNSIEQGRNLLKNKTNLLWQQNEFFESFFSLDDKSFWTIIKPILVKLYEKKSNEAIQEIELTKKLFKKYKFNSILIWTETHVNQIIAIKLAKKENISIHCIQHGFPADSDENIPYMKFQRGNTYYSDNFLVWGNVIKQYVSRLGFSENKVKVLGSPYFDSIFLNKNNNMVINKNFILVAASSPTNDSCYDMTVESMKKYLESIKKICEVSSRMNNDLVIKLHPQPNELDITDFVKNINPKITVLKSGDISPLIESCDVFIVMDISTTILEAQIHEKPVIAFRTRDYLGVSEFIKSNSCISTTVDDFESLFTRVLTDEKFKHEVIERGTKFYKNYLSNPGTASENVLHFLENTDNKS